MIVSRQFVVRAGLACALSALAVGTALYLADAKIDVAALRDRITATTGAPPPPVNPPVPVSVGLSRSEPVKIYLTGIGTVQAYNTVAGIVTLIGSGGRIGDRRD